MHSNERLDFSTFINVRWSFCHKHRIYFRVFYFILFDTHLYRCRPSLPGTTGTKQTHKSSSQWWPRTFPRTQCASASRKERYGSSPARKPTRSAFLSVCAEQRRVIFWSVSSGGPIRWVSSTHRHTDADTHVHTHTHTPPHRPKHASSGALLTLPPKYRSKNNLPSLASPTLLIVCRWEA